MKTMRRWLVAGVLAIAGGVAALPATAQQLPPLGSKWCSNTKIRFFVGGAEGDHFASIIMRGAQSAANDTGATLELVFSGWNNERFIQQLREAIASRPDGIAMMGHPGAAALTPLAEEAKRAGVLLGFQNVDVPEVRAKFGGAYIGANLPVQGAFLGSEAVKRFGLKKGDKAIIFANWANETRVRRELAVVKVLEDAGLMVVKIQTEANMNADPNLMIPLHTAALNQHEDAKLLGYPGGQILGNIATFMDIAGKKPGQYKVIGFDTSPRIIDAFEKGWIDLTSDQQPFLQGYLPVVSLCQQKVIGLAPLVVDTGAGIIDKDNYKGVADLARRGLR
jgi:simple sugar transport system substrate-binding protein